MLLWMHRSIIYVGIEDFYKIPVDHYMTYISDRRYILFLYINQDIYRMMDKKNLLKKTHSHWFWKIFKNWITIILNKEIK